MSDLTTAAAVLGSALAVAKPIVETGCKLIDNLLGEPCKIAGGMIADQIYAWQWTNRIRIAHRAKELMDADDIAPKVLPAGFLVPLLDAAGNVDDPDLQEMWAHLIASGVSDPAHRHPAFVNILRQVSRDEALILTAPSPRCFLVNEGKTPVQPNPFNSGTEDMLSASGPLGFWVNVPLCLQNLREMLTESDISLAEKINKNNVLFYATHLESLGLVDLERKSPYQVLEHIVEIQNSDVGQQFITACCPPSDAA